MPLRHAALWSARLPVHPQWTPGATYNLPTRKWQRPFHTTPPLKDTSIDHATNHYETLKVAPGASAAEIKKSFYHLSKLHHPDANRADPAAASRRFMRISEAYSVLSHPDKRSKYDRDTGLFSHHHPSHLHPQHHRGSWSSSNPAGGRPASGLSKRRTAFRGPPPSFYRSGGWGTHGAKRQAAHEESTAGGGGGGGSGGGASSQQSHRETEDGSRATGSSGAGGMGPGQDPYGHRDEVPHFDRQRHERTGRRHDEHRASAQSLRKDRRFVHVEYNEKSMAAMFFIVSGVLGLSILVPFMYTIVKPASWDDRPRKGREKPAAR